MSNLIQQEWVRETSTQLKQLIAEEGGVKGREKDSVFYMLFTDEKKEEQHLYGFAIDKSCAQTVADLQEYVWEEDNSDPFLDMTAGFETTYGVHDWLSSPSDDVEGIGYTSYEVDPENYLECMTFWRNEMAELFGENKVGPVAHVISYTYDDKQDLYDAQMVRQWSDEDVLNAVKAKLAENTASPKP